MEAEEITWLTTVEVAKRIGVKSINTVKAYLGRVPDEYILRTPGGHLRIREEAVQLLANLASGRR